MANSNNNTATTDKKTKSKKYQSLSTTGLDCLDCNLPAHVCCGQPSLCKKRYAKYLNDKAAAERKWSQPRKRRGRAKNENHG